jgi:hypothetical protein
MAAASASRVAKQAAVGSQLKMLQHHVEASAASGGFDRAGAILERRSVTVDEKGWTALFAETSKFLDRVARIEAAAGARLAKIDTASVEAGVVLLSFETASIADQIPEKPRAGKPMRLRKFATPPSD